MTRIHLVRHGATSFTAEDRFAGASDIPLSDEGRAQAVRLGERLRGERLDAVYASPLRRTLETARILARPHGLEPFPEPGLREIDFGRWEGLRREEIETEFKDEYVLWQQDPFARAPMNGESGHDALGRAMRAFQDIVERHREGSVLVVSHKGTNRLLISQLLGMNVRSYRDVLDQSPAALTIIDVQGNGQARLRLFNDASHCRDMPKGDSPEIAGPRSPVFGGQPPSRWRSMVGLPGVEPGTNGL
jgi:broad specificity phosphatase PhoE